MAANRQTAAERWNSDRLQPIAAKTDIRPHACGDRLQIGYCGLSRAW